MYNKLSFGKIFFVSMVLSQLVGAEVFAGWNCEPGQPDACINKVNNNINVLQSNLDMEKDSLNNAQRYISDCWSSHARMTVVNQQLFKKYDECKGLEVYYQKELPAKIDSDEALLRKNRDFLNRDLCRENFCTRTYASDYK